MSNFKNLAILASILSSFIFGFNLVATFILGYLTYLEPTSPNRWYSFMILLSTYFFGIYRTIIHLFCICIYELIKQKEQTINFVKFMKNNIGIYIDLVENEENLDDNIKKLSNRDLKTLQKYKPYINIYIAIKKTIKEQINNIQSNPKYEYVQQKSLIVKEHYVKYNVEYYLQNLDNIIEKLFELMKQLLCKMPLSNLSMFYCHYEDNNIVTDSTTQEEGQFNDFINSLSKVDDIDNIGMNVSIEEQTKHLKDMMNMVEGLSKVVGNLTNFDSIAIDKDDLNFNYKTKVESVD